MQIAFTIDVGYQFATLTLDDATANGNGSSTTPRLVLQPRLDLSHSLIGPLKKIQLLRLTAQLHFADWTFLEAIPVALTIGITAKNPSLPNQTQTLEFPLTQHAIAAIERLRKGGNVKATFKASLEYEIFATKDPVVEFPLWEIEQRHVQATSAEIDIPSSAWINRVLPQIGVGRVHVVEFPAVPVERCKAFELSFAALRQAIERHTAGLYDDAASKCRIALDPFFEQVEVKEPGKKKKIIPVLRQSWRKRLGNASYDWLNKSFSTIKGATNKSHHSPNAHFDQLESQLLLAVTTAFIAYVARTFGEDEKGG